jgi:hypothetical protein
VPVLLEAVPFVPEGEPVVAGVLTVGSDVSGVGKSGKGF